MQFDNRLRKLAVSMVQTVVEHGRSRSCWCQLASSSAVLHLLLLLVLMVLLLLVMHHGCG
jgi:hypothetical protein